MSGVGLLELATKYVSLTAELEETRRAMRALLGNGAEGEPANDPPRPTKRAARPARASGKRARALRAAAKAEEAIVDLLKGRPMRQAELIKATSASPTTVQQRLVRLKEKGAVERDDAGLWSVSA
jgi:uncharacterized membrane protein